MAYSVSCYSVRGNPALCWQRSGLVLGDVHPEAFSCGNRKFLGLTICWKSNSQYETFTVLVVEPAIHLWWSPLFGQQLQQAYDNGRMLAKIYIFIFEMNFSLHYALVIISNVLLNAYQASLTIIRRNLLRFCVCIVCVCGRPYGSLIFSKHCELTLKIFC